MPRDFALILIVIAALLPWRPALRIRQLLRHPAMSSAHGLAFYVSTTAFQWVVIALVAWRSFAGRWDAQRLALAVWQPQRTARTAQLLTLLLAANQFSVLQRLARIPARQQGTLGEITLPSSLLFPLAHLYQARRPFPATFLASPSFAAAPFRTPAPLPSISAHICTDLLIGLLPLRVLRMTSGPEDTASRVYKLLENQ